MMDGTIYYPVESTMPSKSNKMAFVISSSGKFLFAWKQNTTSIYLQDFEVNLKVN
ncbi:hypothetical protein QUB80_08260 [Chlorogloeopsis sp. ULAP01]|uniref:hypothetical protein n=1 Tax=Chlorogloeopsis sp. ULAP01 TaxID=3056483 RepID=UPI0025AB2AE2|nr:hypothetical protein [Chlorogloeopsis sp. ULAP01]MDM9380698.1 hypothetical protein [Chlorogloeopsis sp. ULAP01]